MQFGDTDDQKMLYGLFVAACLAPAAAVMNIVQTANATADLSTLVKALAAAGLDGTLSGTTPFTVFAPTDLAFAELPAGTLSYLLDPKNVQKLQALLLYHVLNGNVPSTDLGPQQNVSTVNGDQVLVVTNQSAPAPYGRLQVFVNQAQVQAADVVCTNGFVHIINSVLLPPTFLHEVPAAAAVQTVEPSSTTMNIVQTANATADLSTLVKALQAARLTDTLSGPGPFTVFAPTDLAFDKLPAATLSILFQPINIRKLQDLLLYHVVSGTLRAADFGPRQNVTTVNGDQVLVVTNQSAPAPYGRLQVFVNQAQVQAADVMCTNGLVHIINSVLIPPGFL
jgi:transforming growth factor-beta-induced protein